MYNIYYLYLYTFIYIFLFFIFVLKFKIAASIFFLHCRSGSSKATVLFLFDVGRMQWGHTHSQRDLLQ